MSKKSKRAKLIRPMKQLQQSPSVSPQIPERLIDRALYAQKQMVGGDFAGCISTCEALLNSLPKSSERYMEVLSMQGMAHGMLKHYQQSYDIFSEAISIDPTRAELWYNRGLACHFMGRLAATVQNLERAVELTKNDTNEMARKMAIQLEEARQELQEAMEGYETEITLEEFTKREERFAQAMRLTKQHKWSEAEVIFRELTEIEGSNVPSYWGNLGVSLMAQNRYDEAEEALKQALVIDPDYAIARDNLKKLPIVRRSKKPMEIQVINPTLGEDVKQSLALYERDDKGEITDRTIIEKVGHSMTGTWKQTGKQPPRYDLFLNSYQDMRFLSCPRCEARTQLHTYSLVINVNPGHIIILDKVCRHCNACGLLIVHKDELEKLLTKTFRKIDQKVIGNDYLVMGTLDRAKWSREQQELSSFEQVAEYLHDFKEVVQFSRVPVEE